MSNSTQANPVSGFEIVIGWLVEKDTKKREAAVSMLSRLGTEAAPILVDEASKPGKRAAHRVAILDIVQRIGGPPEPDTMFGLQSLLSHTSSAVREKAERVIMSFAPCGIPESAEGLALMRCLNPFLQPLPRRQRQRSSPPLAG